MHKTFAKQEAIFGHEIILKNSMTKLNKQDALLIRFIFGILNEENIKKYKTKTQNKCKYGENPFFIISCKNDTIFI